MVSNAELAFPGIRASLKQMLRDVFPLLFLRAEFLAARREVPLSNEGLSHFLRF